MASVTVVEIFGNEVSACIIILCKVLCLIVGEGKSPRFESVTVQYLSIVTACFMTDLF